MIEDSEKKISCIEDALEFYNRYLALDNDDQYLLNLIDKLADIFISKSEQTSDLEVNLRFVEKDLTTLSHFEKSCINFLPASSINVDDELIAFIDKFGTIVCFNGNEGLERFIGKNILNILDELLDFEYYYNVKQEVFNIIIQNIFVSKLYKAIKERIYTKTAGKYITLFKRANENILSYERNLVDKKINISQINKGFTRVRSNR